MKKNRPVHLEIQGHRKNYYGLIRSSYRQDGKVKHSKHGRLSGMSKSRLMLVQAALRGDVVPKDSCEAMKSVESKEYGASCAVLAVARDIGLDKAIYSRREQWADDIMAMVAGRIVYAGSKLALSHQWKNTSLWELCGVSGPVDVDVHCYDALDRLLSRQKAIENALAAKYLGSGRLVLYDITSSYFEGEYNDSDIVYFGYNRDGKRGHEQMVIGLVCNEAGCPVGVEVFPGNTQDASTVPEKIRQIQEQYGVKELLFVGDRGMVTQANAEKLKDTEGLRMISALTHKQIVDLLARKVITPELFDEHKIVEMIDPDKPSRRYALCRNPLTASRETHTRKDLLEVTRKQLDKIAGAKKKSSAEKIGSRVGRILQKYKMGKFVKWETKDGRLLWRFDEDKIAAELLLDGCYVIWTDIKPEQMVGQKVVESYKKLQQVEMAIRNLKTVLLEVRPVFHKTDERIRAHVFLCMLADHVQWHMKKRLQPLFDDDGVGKSREWTFISVVERLKAIRREKRVLGDISFFQTTVPADDQQRILDLLEITL